MSYVGADPEFPDVFWVDSNKIKLVLSNEEKFQKKLRDQLDIIEASAVSYQVAGHIASHQSKFNISYPPGQRDLAINAIMKYGIHFVDKILTAASDASAGWSCTLLTPDHKLAQQLYQETGVNTSNYYDRVGEVTLHAREFVLGFLGGVLKFQFGVKNQNIEEIRSHVPSEFLAAFDFGFGEPLGCQA